MGDGVERRDLNGAEGPAGFRDHQVEETIRVGEVKLEFTCAGRACLTKRTSQTNNLMWE